MCSEYTLRSILKPIQARLDQPATTDIIVNKPFRVAFRAVGGWEWMDVPSFDWDTLDAASILIARRNGKEFDEAHPHASSTLPGGQRWQGVRDPGTMRENILWAIRRPPTVARNIDDDDFDDLFQDAGSRSTRRQMARAEMASHYKAKRYRDCFKAARMAGLNMAMIGPTGGGKSDFGRRMIKYHRPGIPGW